MYQIKCDDYVLYDPREEDLVLTEPKCKVEVNTVGEASFTIYANHPYYSTLRKKRSIIEILQDGEAIFRGRITDDTLDFDNVKYVDVEGVLAFFNDSIIRPFAFPGDFTEDEGYIAAAAGGNVIAYFLGWIINQHNAQVDEFQRFKLGNVTVTDSNNYITRSSEDYNKTWDILKTKLFDSSFGGYLCIRYEADGNYIDYLADFEHTNSQPIVYGENLLDLTNESDATETFSAILPRGVDLNADDETASSKNHLTIAELPDGNITDDIVKQGDILYSISARNTYGFVCVPPADSIWEDVTIAKNLQTKAAEYLSSQASKLRNTLTVKAVDLHFSDEDIESFRIYRYVNVESAPHNQQGSYLLTQIDLDIDKPQNTVFTLGDKTLTLTDMNSAKNQDMAQMIESTSGEANKKANTAVSQVQTLTQEIENNFLVTSNTLDVLRKIRFAYGIVQPVLGSGTDLDDVITPNTYMGNNPESANYKNCPVKGAFVLEVLATGAGLIQRITSGTDEITVIHRCYNDSTWGEWA